MNPPDSRLVSFVIPVTGARLLATLHFQSWIDPNGVRLPTVVSESENESRALESRNIAIAGYSEPNFAFFNANRILSEGCSIAA